MKRAARKPRNAGSANGGGMSVMRRSRFFDEQAIVARFDVATGE